MNPSRAELRIQLDNAVTHMHAMEDEHGHRSEEYARAISVVRTVVDRLYPAGMFLRPSNLESVTMRAAQIRRSTGCSMSAAIRAANREALSHGQ